MRGGARAAMVSGAFGGVILAVIEGLNIAVTKYFAKLGPPDPIPIEEVASPADQPWYIRMIAPAPPAQNDVDFSDPKEMAAAPGFSDPRPDNAGGRVLASALEPQVDRSAPWMLAGPWMLVRAHAYAAGREPGVLALAAAGRAQSR